MSTLPVDQLLADALKALVTLSDHQGGFHSGHTVLETRIRALHEFAKTPVAPTAPAAAAEPSECIGTQIAKDEFAKRWDEAYQRKVDQDVTPEYLQWLQDSAPREGVGGNVAWNAGVAWERRARAASLGENHE